MREEGCFHFSVIQYRQNAHKHERFSYETTAVPNADALFWDLVSSEATVCHLGFRDLEFCAPWRSLFGCGCAALRNTCDHLRIKNSKNGIDVHLNAFHSSLEYCPVNPSTSCSAKSGHGVSTTPAFNTSASRPTNPASNASQSNAADTADRATDP